MPQVINTNSMSLMARNNLNKSQSSLNLAIEKLSSGKRINSAKDGASESAIANRFTANIRGLTQAARNANDGISISQTAEGALNEINNNVQRIRELTVKAANGTNSDKDVAAIQKEVEQRLEEINRIADSTSFNGTKLFAEGVKDLVIQVGANDKETITIKLSQFNAKEMGLEGFEVAKAGGKVDNGGKDDDKDKDKGGEGGEGFSAQSVNGQETDSAAHNRARRSLSEVSPYAPDPDNQLSKLDEALAKIDDLRSQFGAAQNRFESAIAAITTTTFNLTESRSRIEDADYAEEVSNMTRSQILQQAGTSVLAQANQVPQLVLSLLQ